MMKEDPRPGWRLLQEAGYSDSTDKQFTSRAAKSSTPFNQAMRYSFMPNSIIPFGTRISSSLSFINRTCVQARLWCFASWHHYITLYWKNTCSPKTPPPSLAPPHLTSSPLLHSSSSAPSRLHPLLPLSSFPLNLALESSPPRSLLRPRQKQQNPFPGKFWHLGAIIPKGGDFYSLFSLLFPKCLAQCLAYNRSSTDLLSEWVFPWHLARTLL